MKLAKSMIITAIVAVFFVSCKDDSTDPSKKDLITTGSWITSDVLIDGTSIWSLVDACSKDDYMTFNANGTVVTDEGPTKCDAADPQTTTDNWSLSADETKITLDGDVGELTTINSTDMVITTKDSASTFVLKLKKK